MLSHNLPKGNVVGVINVETGSRHRNLSESMGMRFAAICIFCMLFIFLIEFFDAEAARLVAVIQVLILVAKIIHFILEKLNEFVNFTLVQTNIVDGDFHHEFPTFFIHRV